MCAESKAALEQRKQAAHQLMEACSRQCMIRERLRLVYPVEPVPYDLNLLALRIGGPA